MTRQQFWELCAMHVPRYEFAESREKWSQWADSKEKIRAAITAHPDLIEDEARWKRYWNGEGPQPADPGPD